MKSNDLPSATAPRRAAAFYDGRSYAVADSVGNLMHRIVLAMRRDIEQGMAEHDLTAAQWHPLWKLKTGAAGTAQELACQLGIDAGAVTRLLDRLEAKGLVERLRSQTDRRVVQLSLTEAGEAAVARVPVVLAEVNNRYLGGFSGDEWQTLKELLKRMLANAIPPPSDANGRAAAGDPASRSPAGRQRIPTRTP